MNFVSLRSNAIIARRCVLKAAYLWPESARYTTTLSSIQYRKPYEHLYSQHRYSTATEESETSQVSSDTSPTHQEKSSVVDSINDTPTTDTNTEKGKPSLNIYSAEISTSSVLISVSEYRQKYPSCVLLVRVGDFYELYFDQADEIGGHVLGLQVTDKKFRNGTVRFTGFPARSINRYLEILVTKHGLSVAICEQFQEPMRRTFTRKVTRVITPGTLIDDQYSIDTRMHNYILSVVHVNQAQLHHLNAMDELRHKQKAEEMMLRKTKFDLDYDRANTVGTTVLDEPSDESVNTHVYSKDTKISDPNRKQIYDQVDPEVINGPSDGDGPVILGLAWLDLATGDFMTSTTSPDTLATDIARIRPREILIEKGNAYMLSLINTACPLASTARQVAGAPAITEVDSDIFYKWSAYDPDIIDPNFEDSAAGESPSGPDVEDNLIQSQDNGLRNPNTYWRLSAPSQALIMSPEKLLVEATELMIEERMASRALLNYVVDTQLGLLPPLQPPKRYIAESHLKMSGATIQALELVRPISASVSTDGNVPEHTLLKEIDYTKTSAGARLLSKRLTSPSTSIDIIERRLDLVEFFRLHTRARDLLREHLEHTSDIERAVNKLSLNCGGPQDLLSIAYTLREVKHIKTILDDSLNTSYLNKLVPGSKFADKTRNTSTAAPTKKRRPKNKTISHRLPQEILKVARSKEAALCAIDTLVNDIQRMIRDDAERDIRMLGFLKPNCSAKITMLHKKLSKKQHERIELERKWRTEYSCNSLKLDSIPALGHFIEVSKRDSSALLVAVDKFRMIQSLKNKVRFENNDWTYLLSEIEMLRNLIRAEELRVFEELRDQVLGASTIIKTNCAVLAQLDVSISMAVLSINHQYIRPVLVDPNQSKSPHLVVNGRHPVVESRLIEAGRQFVGNNCKFGEDHKNVLLLTGPNMGGKSTYLRQVALISILGQMGSFVPADEAVLHIIHSVYSRIGAHDNLALDQSTFMVEMSETADILRHATKDSLVILDEIGRGTSTTDGISIAYATLDHIHKNIGCKALFATHYHELVPHVVPRFSGVTPIHTATYEDGVGGFAFLHKVKPGVCSKSHGLYVAQIAGIPEYVLKTARAFSRLNKDF